MTEISLFIKDLLYLQSSIKGTFKDGRLLNDLINELKDGSKEPTDLPILRVIEATDEDGKPEFYSLDHRRLYCLKEAFSLDETATVSVKVYNFDRMVDLTSVGDEESISILIELYKKLTTNDPENIRIRNGTPCKVKAFDDWITKSTEKLVENEALKQGQLYEAQDAELIDEISRTQRTDEEIRFEYLKEVLRIRLENGESGVLEDDGGDNDTIERIERTLEGLDMVQELMSNIDNALECAGKQLAEVKANYAAIQRRNAEQERELHASRAQVVSRRAMFQQQMYSVVPSYHDWRYSYSSSSAYTPMIQTHDGSLFPVGTSTNTIRNTLIEMGTFESGHGPIADCPIVNTSDM